MIQKIISVIPGFVKNLVTLGFSIALFYTIFGNLRRRSRFKYVPEWFSGVKLIKRKKLVYAVLKFSGILKNESLDPNSVVRVYLVVWKDKKRNKVLRSGFGGVTLKKRKKTIHLPLRFKPREARHLEIAIEFPVTGTSDQKILGDMSKPTGFVARNRVEAWFLSRKYRVKRTGYELAFEDINENLFDQYGNLRNDKEIDLWWTLPNFKGRKKLFHLSKIYWCKTKFVTKKFLRNIGLFV